MTHHNYLFGFPPQFTQVKGPLRPNNTHTKINYHVDGIPEQQQKKQMVSPYNSDPQTSSGVSQFLFLVIQQVIHKVRWWVTLILLYLTLLALSLLTLSDHWGFSPSPPCWGIEPYVVKTHLRM